jgi:protocatechuate 3,4-dioxygenase beta subunit
VIARLLVSVLTLGLLVCSVTAHAQARDRPAPSEAPAAVGTVEGRVVITVNGQPAPVRRARVILAAGQIATDADAEGYFRFERVPAGRYQVVAQKPGFVPDSAAVPIDLAPQQRASVQLLMQRGAALEGRVVGVDGKPVTNLVVSVDRLAPTSDGYSRGETRWERTDDLGRFRIHTLPPGQYRLHAAAPPQTFGDEMYFPGTPNEQDAAVITLTAGQTLQQLDLTVAANPAANHASETDPGEPISENAQRVSGRVTSAEIGQPLPEAQVMLDCAGPPATKRSVSTNGDGRFQFLRVRSGPCTMTVTADGHQPPQTGSSWRPNKVIDVKPGEPLTNADVILIPVRAIEGRVVDEFGDPVPGAVVEVLGRQSLMGQSFLVPMGSLDSRRVTDDRGWFRMYGLIPQDYYLRARTGLFGVPGGLISSLNIDSPGGFAPTLYPGARTTSDASIVRLGPTADAVDLTFPLVPSHTTSVNGAVLDSDGRPVPRANVLLQATDNDAVGPTTVNTAASASGIFRFDRVPDGTYLLRTMPAGQTGQLTVDVLPSSPIINVTLPVRPLARTRGHVTFDGGRPAERVTLVVLPTERTSFSFSVGSPVNPDGSFEALHSVPLGFIRTQTAGWAVKSVVLNGQDITDVPFDFQGADVAGIEVTITNHLGSVEASVLEGDTRVPDATVILFSADPAQWTFSSRRLSAGGPSPTSAGVVVVTDLLPGPYLAVAVNGRVLPTMNGRMSPALVDPEWLARLRPSATPITISEGVNEPLRLQLAKEPTGATAPR